MIWHPLCLWKLLPQGMEHSGCSLSGSWLKEGCSRDLAILLPEVHSTSWMWLVCPFTTWCVVYLVFIQGCQKTGCLFASSRNQVSLLHKGEVDWKDVKSCRCSRKTGESKLASNRTPRPNWQGATAGRKRFWWANTHTHTHTHTHTSYHLRKQAWCVHCHSLKPTSQTLYTPSFGAPVTRSSWETES
jgi:hypothetical protein